MEFVDYKCLESLIIEGEDMIALEGVNFDQFKAMLSRTWESIVKMLQAIKRAIMAAFQKMRGNHLVKSGKKVTNVGPILEQMQNSLGDTLKAIQKYMVDILIEIYEHDRNKLDELSKKYNDIEKMVSDSVENVKYYASELYSRNSPVIFEVIYNEYVLDQDELFNRTIDSINHYIRRMGTYQHEANRGATLLRDNTDIVNAARALSLKVQGLMSKISQAIAIYTKSLSKVAIIIHKNKSKANYDDFSHNYYHRDEDMEEEPPIEEEE